VSNPDVRVKRAYIWLLGFKPQWQPADMLRRALEDADAIVRARAVEGLARLGETANEPTVRGLLNDPDHRVRAAATTALEKR
jgi:HEAT repeat protein